MEITGTDLLNIVMDKRFREGHRKDDARWIQAVMRVERLLTQFGTDLAFQLNHAKSGNLPRLDATLCKPIDTLIRQNQDWQAGDMLANPDLIDVRQEIALWLNMRVRIVMHSAFHALISYIKRHKGKCNLQDFGAKEDGGANFDLHKVIHQILRNFGPLERRQAYAKELLEEMLESHAAFKVTVFSKRVKRSSIVHAELSHKIKGGQTAPHTAAGKANAATDSLNVPPIATEQVTAIAEIHEAGEQLKKARADADRIIADLRKRLKIAGETYF